MACDTRGGNFYWYDREEGCFGFTSAKEMRQALEADYKSGKSRFFRLFRKKHWYAIRCTGLAA